VKVQARVTQKNPLFFDKASSWKCYGRTEEKPKETQGRPYGATALFSYLAENRENAPRKRTKHEKKDMEPGSRFHLYCGTHS
jgi:hypothetical protein